MQFGRRNEETRKSLHYMYQANRAIQHKAEVYLLETQESKINEVDRSTHSITQHI